jgi:hypothetical protein
VKKLLSSICLVSAAFAASTPVREVQSEMFRAFGPAGLPFPQWLDVPQSVGWLMGADGENLVYCIPGEEGLTGAAWFNQPAGSQ